jgi:hypothetical protein
MPPVFYFVLMCAVRFYFVTRIIKIRIWIEFKISFQTIKGFGKLKRFPILYRPWAKSSAAHFSLPFIFPICSPLRPLLLYLAAARTTPATHSPEPAPLSPNLTRLSRPIMQANPDTTVHCLTASVLPCSTPPCVVPAHRSTPPPQAMDPCWVVARPDSTQIRFGP